MLLMGFSGTMAQNGEIIYTDYEPDLEVIGNDESLYIDMDSSVGPWYYMEVINDGWGYFCLNPSYNIIPDTTSFNTLTTWNIQNCWNVDGGEKFAVRHVVGDDVYYGWFRAYWSWSYLPTNAPIAHMHLDQYAFCTVANYPMHYGQTSLDGVEEPNGPSVAIHPNPTNSVVTITGESEDISKIGVLNAWGQTIITENCTSNNISIDISNLTAGVYIMKVKLADDKEFTGKLIKK